MLLEYKRNSIRDLSIQAHTRLQWELDRTLELPRFIDELIANSKDGDKGFHGSNTLYKEPYPRTIRIAPSVKEMYQAVMSINNKLIQIDKSDTSDDQKFLIKRDMVREVIKPKQIIILDKPLDIWWGDSLKGLNCRPGFVNNDRSKCYPFKMGGTQSHVCAGGNTGEGKSVAMNAILHSWLVEYPPWELQLFMNDMKMLEYARYNLGSKCPHIRNIAITGSTTYLTSAIEFFDNEMLLLYNLSTMTGSNSFEGLRRYLDMYIARQVMITDEYSQLKEKGTNKENMKVDFHVQSVVKLGRAVAYHKFITAQTFKDAIKPDTLGQFKVGLCVGANDDNSESILGNTDAVRLTKKIGYCLVNSNRAVGEVSGNVEYKVAFLNDITDEDKMKFQNLLRRVCDTADMLGIADKPTSFNEKMQPSYEELKSNIAEYKNEMNGFVEDKKLIAMCNIMLGEGTRYTGTSSVREFFPWYYGRKSNILIHSNDKSSIRYLCKLVGDNLVHNGIDVEHRMIIDNQELYSENIVPRYKKDLTGDFNVDSYLGPVVSRDILLKYNNYCKGLELDVSITGYIKFLLGKDKSNKLNTLFAQFPDLDLDSLYYDTLEEILEEESYTLGEDADAVYQWLFDNKECLSVLLGYQKFYNKTMSKITGKYLTNTDFGLNIFWMFCPQLNEGIQSYDGVSDKFIQLLTMGPSVGVFFVVVIDEPKGLKRLITTCKHLLTGSIHPDIENMGLVEFRDLSGICCKYTVCEGKAEETYYFKKYFINED